MLQYWSLAYLMTKRHTNQLFWIVQKHRKASSFGFSLRLHWIMLQILIWHRLYVGCLSWHNPPHHLSGLWAGSTSGWGNGGNVVLSPSVSAALWHVLGIDQVALRATNSADNNSCRHGNICSNKFLFFFLYFSFYKLSKQSEPNELL